VLVFTRKRDQAIVIGDGVWIGANAILLPGVRVGRHSVIAAGSVVTKSVEPFSVYGGVKSWCEVLHRLRGSG